MISGVRSIVRMPVESVLQMLCTVNYILNDEKLELKDICIYEHEQAELTLRQAQQQAQERLSVPAHRLQPPTDHNTYDIEQLLLRMVRKGDTVALREWFATAPAIRGGVVAGDPLRQRKNLFIVTVTLASRAAIQGGMQVDDAFTLSDSYIRQCELLSIPERITNLQYRMLMDYTERVERLRRGKTPSKLAVDVANYCTGSSTAMVEPFSELASTHTQPPWRSAISHTRESPSPAPPYSRLRDLSTRKKGWKMLC